MRELEVVGDKGISAIAVNFKGRLICRITTDLRSLRSRLITTVVLAIICNFRSLYIFNLSTYASTFLI